MKTAGSKIVFLVLLFPLLQNCSSNDAGADSIIDEDSSQVNLDSLSKLYFVNDATLLNLVFHTTYSEPTDSTRNSITGELSHEQRIAPLIDGDSSITVRCERPVFFSAESDSLCFIDIQGIAFSGTDRTYRQYYILLVYARDHWELADSTLNISTSQPVMFTEVQKFGPYSFLKSKYATGCENGGISTGENYLVIFENRFLHEADYDLELHWSDSCIMDRVTQSVLRALEITYDDSTRILQYDEIEKYESLYNTQDYVSRRRYICYRRNFCIVMNIMKMRNRTDTVFFMDDEAIGLQLKKWKSSD